MNGWTPTIPQEVRISNERQSLQLLVKDNPGNQYWKNALETFNEAHSIEEAYQMEQADKPDNEIERDNNWLDSDVTPNLDGTEPSPVISGGEVLYITIS